VFPRPEPWGKYFYDGLREEGFVEGENVIVSRRETGTDFSLAGPLAHDLIAQGADVIVAQPGPIAREAKQAVERTGKSIPIVFLSYDPVEEGFVTSLSRPDRNMTGVTSQVSTEIYTKHLEFLLEILPGISRVGYLLDPTAAPAAFEGAKAHLDKAVAAKGVRLTIARVNSVEAIESVIEKLKRDKVGALIVPPTAFAVTHRRILIDTIARVKLPAIWGHELFVRDGALVGYWPSMDEIQRTLGRMTGMLLKGKRASEIAVEQPRRFKLTINATTASHLGLKLSPSLLVRADEVIK
jgi:putative ABC transport system substrate-binding protein